MGLTSRYGTYLVSCKLQDTTGVIAQNVLDAATFLTVIATTILFRIPACYVLIFQGIDPEDPGIISDYRDGGKPRRSEQGIDFRKACTKTGVQGVRIAVCRAMATNISSAYMKLGFSPCPNHRRC